MSINTKDKAYGICIYKKNKNSIKILLCKSTMSNTKWGTIKGGMEAGETKEQTAIREFQEESSILVNKDLFEKYFEQINNEKDIGVYLVNYNNIKNIDKYFDNEMLKKEYLNWENSKITFFDINDLPTIKQKQYKMVDNIIQYLQKD